jgi:hypothetical protein
MATPTPAGLISALEDFDFISLTPRSEIILSYALAFTQLYGQSVLSVGCISSDQYRLCVTSLHDESLNDIPIPPRPKKSLGLLRNLQLEYKNGIVNTCAIIPIGVLLVNGLQSNWIVVMDEHHNLSVLHPSAIDEDDYIDFMAAKDPWFDAYRNNAVSASFSASGQKTIFDTTPSQNVFHLGPVSLLKHALGDPKQLISPQPLSEVIRWSSTAKYLIPEGSL